MCDYRSSSMHGAPPLSPGLACRACMWMESNTYDQALRRYPPLFTCAVCSRSECYDHLLASFLFPSMGTGFDGGALEKVEEIETILKTARLAWVTSIKAYGVPVPPEWIAKSPLLTNYFYAFGPFDDFKLDADETDVEAAESLTDLAWDHSQLVRDFLAAVLPECGWEGRETLIHGHDDDGDFPIECLSRLDWSALDSTNITEMLRAMLGVMLRNGEPA